MYELYYIQGACSLAVHVALNELGADFKLHKLEASKGEHKAPEYLKINPMGQVGAIVTPEGVITENAAILIYLDDKHDGNLLPKSGYERAIALQWLMFANSTLHTAYSKAMFSQRNNAGEDVINAAKDAIQKLWDEVEKHLEVSGGNYLAGNELTAADIYLSVVANWLFTAKPKLGAKTKALIEAVSSRESFKKAIESENVEYKALAA